MVLHKGRHNFVEVITEFLESFGDGSRGKTSRVRPPSPSTAPAGGPPPLVPKEHVASREPRYQVSRVQRSSKNRRRQGQIKHGLFGRSPHLPTEDAADEGGPSEVGFHAQRAVAWRSSEPNPVLLASSLSEMKIAIIGTGKVGRGFATALSPKHKVVLGSTDPARAAKVVRATGAAGAATYQEAASGADIVILVEDVNHPEAAYLLHGLLLARLRSSCGTCTERR